MAVLSRFEPVHRYVAVVIAAGTALIAYSLITQDLRLPSDHAAAFWLFIPFVVLGELFPVRIPHRREVEEFTTSTTFALALMLGWGTGRAIVALAAASAAADFLHGKQIHKVLFNVSQYALAIGAAGAVFHALGGTMGISGMDVLPMVGAAVTFFVVNTALIRVAIALSLGLPVARHLFSELGLNAGISAALLGMSPVVMVLAEHRPLFLPFLALPLAGIYLGTRASLRNYALTELNQLKDDFVATVSHELRTPLTSIQGYIKSLRRLGKALDQQEREEFLAVADRQSDRLRSLIEQLLVVAQLDSGRADISRSPISVPVLAEAVVEELRGDASGHRFDIRFQAQFPIVHSDQGKLHQVLSNLVENALKYSRPHGAIRIRGRPEGESVLITVEDDGPGIPPEDQKRIFDRFFQVDQSRTRNVGGTGLGLYICRRLTEAMEGRLWLATSSERGSTFALRIPVTPGRRGRRDTIHPVQPQLAEKPAVSR
jgi:signal transduction histidine kinase